MAGFGGLIGAKRMFAGFVEEEEEKKQERRSHSRAATSKAGQPISRRSG